MIRLAERRILLVWSVGNADGIWRVHGTIQHSNFVYNCSLQERPLLHQSHGLVQLVLEIIIATLTCCKTIIGIEVPTNVSGAATGNVLTLSTCVRDETVDVVQIHSNEWCSKVFITFGNNRCRSFFPLADLRISTLRIVPTIW